MFSVELTTHLVSRPHHAGSPCPLTGVVPRENFGPLLPCMSQAVSQSNPLPGQQAFRADLVKEGRVENIVGGLGHHETASQEIEVIQGHEET